MYKKLLDSGFVIRAQNKHFFFNHYPTSITLTKL